MANRYKLNKNYTKLKAKSEAHPDDLAIKTRCTQAEVSETGVCVDELIASGFIHFLSRLDLNTSYLIFFRTNEHIKHNLCKTMQYSECVFLYKLL